MKKFFFILSILFSFNSFSSHLMVGNYLGMLKSGPDAGKYIFTESV